MRRVFAATWNVNGLEPKISLDSWLMYNEELQPDIYIIG